jgi:hypothetical protein
MSHIVDTICDTLVARLQYDLIDSLGTSDLARATIVKKGRYQDDPVRDSIFLAVQGGNLENPNQLDGIVSLGSHPNIGWSMPPYEVGGAAAWWRKGIVNIGCYFIQEQYTEEVAMEVAYTVLGRTEYAIETLSLDGLSPDDWGEVAFKMFLVGTNFFMSGGPPKTYIWRGKVHWMCLTQKP